jgi:hypothetical protein
MRLAPLAFLIVLCGCAGLDQTACRSADWYDLGFRDAIFGLQPQDNIYSGQCEPAVRIDVARYNQGWREGKYEADARRNESVD